MSQFLLLSFDVFLFLRQKHTQTPFSDDSSSALGITCHFCRQKTTQKHVYCLECVLALCGPCLRNRHGEPLLPFSTIGNKIMSMWDASIAFNIFYQSLDVQEMGM